jgi:hypothetical protein
MSVPVNVAGLWNHWDPNQKNANIHRSAVERYIQIMRTMTFAGSAAVRGMMQGQVQPIFFEALNEDMTIRTADGRHRITAAHELGLPTIQALNTPLTQMIKDIFNI